MYMFGAPIGAAGGTVGVLAYTGVAPGTWAVAVVAVGLIASGCLVLRTIAVRQARRKTATGASATQDGP